MSRIESGKMYLEEKPCSLPEILHGLRNIEKYPLRAVSSNIGISSGAISHGVHPLTVVNEGILNRSLISRIASAFLVCQFIVSLLLFDISMVFSFITEIKQPPYFPKIIECEVS